MNNNIAIELDTGSSTQPPPFIDPEIVADDYGWFTVAGSKLLFRHPLDIVSAYLPRQNEQPIEPRARQQQQDNQPADPAESPHGSRHPFQLPALDQAGLKAIVSAGARTDSAGGTQHRKCDDLSNVSWAAKLLTRPHERAPLPRYD
ncbi:MAG TPA: hypothetical protein VHY20_05740 [Pirellulales bacterium]|nr:hypothetical protein [Pirellulales bacterium]